MKRILDLVASLLFRETAFIEYIAWAGQIERKLIYLFFIQSVDRFSTSEACTLNRRRHIAALNLSISR